MKKRIVFHYSLYIAIIFGAFASMAQNSYGLTIISIACYLFSISLITEVAQKFKTSTWSKIIELVSLATLFVLFGLRAAYIHFLHVELLLILICTNLIILYLLQAISISNLNINNTRLRILALVYYTSLIGFTLSIIITLIFPFLGEPMGGLSTTLLFIFIGGVFISKTQLVNGEEVKTTDYLRDQVGHSLVLMTGFFLISIYSGLYMIGILPPLYTDAIPHSYIELINAAETGKEKPVDGVYKYELYKEAYDKFLERNNLSE